MLHLVNLAELSQEPVAIAVVFFGGDGVRVMGDKDGQPTMAYATLRQELVGHWPKPEGATPMDETFQKVVNLLRAVPQGSPISVVLLSDGQPESGRLRPKEFSEIAQEMTRQREAVMTKYQGHPPEILQHFVRKLETAWETPGTQEFLGLYRRQVQAEFQATMGHAANLAKQKVRFVTIDFGGGIPALQEIHQAAAGKPGDLVVTGANSVIGKLHELGLTALPRIVLAPVRSYEAQTDRFEQTIEVPIDSVADSAMIVVEFKTAVAGFADHASLTATVGGTELTFSTDNLDSHQMVAFDSKGSLATATLLVDAIPKDGRVAFRFQSPRASLHVPACTVYTYLRLSAATTADLRPSNAAVEALPAYAVAAARPGTFRFALRTKGEPKPIAVRGAEAVLRAGRQRSPLHLALRPDANAPGLFVSDETALPAGSYDVDLYVILPSGAKLNLTLLHQFESQERDEAVTVEILQPTHGSREAGLPLGHVAFGQVGDDVTSQTLLVVLRSLGTDEPITLVPSVALADSEGNMPSRPWIAFDKAQVVLQPGRAQPLRATLSLPKEIEETVRDGQFEGKLSLLQPDSRQPVALRPYRKIAGVPDDEPVDRITFTLVRPKLMPTAPYTLRNWIIRGGDGRLGMKVHVSIGQPFGRGVRVTVTHDSLVARPVTTLPSAVVVDSGGRQVPQIRLTACEGTELTQEFRPGGTGLWDFQFAMDADCRTDHATGAIDVSSPGLTPQHITVLVDRRDPLLAAAVRWICLVLIGISLVALLRLTWRRIAVGRLRTGAQHVLTSKRPLAGVLSLESGRAGTVQITAAQPVKISSPGEVRAKLVPAQSPAMIRTDAISPSRPVTVKFQPSDGGEGCELQITECLASPDGEHEVHVEIIQGADADRERERLGRAMVKRFTVAAACGLLAVNLMEPHVLVAVQWVYDVLFKS